MQINLSELLFKAADYLNSKKHVQGFYLKFDDAVPDEGSQIELFIKGNEPVGCCALGATIPFIPNISYQKFHKLVKEINKEYIKFFKVGFPVERIQDFSDRNTKKDVVARMKELASKTTLKVEI